MEFLECIKLYAKKPKNSLINSAVKKPDAINWDERLQSIRRSIIDQLSRLKIEEMTLRNLALKNEQIKRGQTSTLTLSTAANQDDDDDDEALTAHRKRFCTIPANSFDAETINQTELDLDL